jgi:hypothetical protein
MVQVDVFWSYAIGAGLASAAARQIAKSGKSAACADGGDSDCLLGNRYFTATVIYLAALFAPSGIGLLWAFPSWETMHAGDRDLPTWLVMAFSITNITQGIAGFWISKKLIRAGKYYLASLQMTLGYFLMFLVLVHGWDGNGYKRFFSATQGDWLNWSFWNIPRWLHSDVALTLYGMGIALLPVLFVIMSGWIIQGRRDEGDKVDISRLSIMRLTARVILGGSLVFAIVASLLIHLIGWVFGLLVFAVLAYFLALRRGAYLHSWLAQMHLRAPGSF